MRQPKKQSDGSPKIWEIQVGGEKKVATYEVEAISEYAARREAKRLFRNEHYEEPLVSFKKGEEDVNAT